jgi:hypothetical protein
LVGWLVGFWLIFSRKLTKSPYKYHLSFCMFFSNPQQMYFVFVFWSMFFNEVVSTAFVWKEMAALMSISLKTVS